jgi:O-antigen/teichoic acid export membrane protein
MADVETAGEVSQLKRRAARGSLYEIASYAASNVIRLGSNLVLSRLLFPEAFGLMALVQILNTGLLALSEVGIEPAVVQSPRGDDKRFLDTAWTLQVIRCTGLFVIAVALAYPMAAIYDQAQLGPLVMAGAFSLLMAGFQSTSLYTLRRRLSLGRLAAIDVGSHLLGVLVMLALAYYDRSPWPLVVGALVSTGSKVAASHWVDAGYRNRFHLDHEARRAITTFGKWIFGASVFVFLSRQGDRLLLGRMLGMAELGVYSIAVFLCEAVTNAVAKVTMGVMYPMLSKVQEGGKEAIRKLYYEVRLPLDAMSMLGAGTLIMLGPQIVNLLYDPRYATAGWMLQALGVRVAMASLLGPCEWCLFALGQTRWGLIQNFGRTVWMVIALPIGWKLDGLRGLVMASALSEVPVLLILWPAFYREGMLRFAKEARALALLALGLGLGWLVSQLWVALA